MADMFLRHFSGIKTTCRKSFVAQTLNASSTAQDDCLMFCWSPNPQTARTTH